MPPPGDIHGAVQSNVVTQLKIQGEFRGLGRARTEVGLILRRNPDRLTGPDAVFATAALLPLRRSAEGYLETIPELVEVMKDLRAVDVDILTLGQYLRPSDAHIALDRYYTPDEFRELYRIGMELGFRHVESGPLVRSSYHAWEQVQAAGV